MENTLYGHIRQYLSMAVYPFHMPGHKRNAAFLPPELTAYDLTEIPGMDNLQNPGGILREAREYAARVYGADESFMLVNGSTAGIIAAVCAAAGDGDLIGVARNCHQSVYNALALSGVVPEYVMPEYFPDGLAGGIKPFDKPYKAVIITSPTYEGFVSDITAVADAVHKNGGILIVDEAHGAHFAFHEAFPRPAAECGADIVINSPHKTLPVLTQCAVLHVRGGRADREKLRFYINAVQTSSPSYILLTSMDYALRTLNEHPEYFEAYAKRLNRLRDELNNNGNHQALRLTGPERLSTAGVFDIDRGKLLFETRAAKTGAEIDAIMSGRYRVQMEFSNARFILGMTSVADTGEGFERLLNAVNALNNELPYRETPPPCVPPPPEPAVALTPREAMRRETETVELIDAKGQISGGFITPYPPGVPLLAPGERVTEEIINTVAAPQLNIKYIKIIKGGCRA